MGADATAYFHAEFGVDQGLVVFEAPGDLVALPEFDELETRLVRGARTSSPAREVPPIGP